MRDLGIALSNRPGALAALGETLGRAGVSIEGGGVFAAGDSAVAHFLMDDGAGGTSRARARRLPRPGRQ